MDKHRELDSDQQSDSGESRESGDGSSGSSGDEDDDEDDNDNNIQDDPTIESFHHQPLPGG